MAVPSATTKRLLSIGECMIEIAAAGNGMYRQNFAGDTFNTAWYARRALGAAWQVDYFTCVGDDEQSARMLAFMAAQGIGIDGIQRLKGRTPGLYLISLDNGERSFTYWRDTSAARSLADDEKHLDEAVTRAGAIYFSGITLAILTPDRRDVLFRVLEKAKARGAMVAFDSNIRLRLWPSPGSLREALNRAAKVVTLALPTVPDEFDVFGDTDQNAVAARYLGAGVSEVAVKAGAGPALVVWPGGRELVAPAEIITPVDTTGAGDSFNGSYIAARLQGDDPVTAAHKAHATAGRVIQSYGALV